MVAAAGLRAGGRLLCRGVPALGAERAACREDPALRRLSRRGRQFQDGENSVARRPAGVLHPQSAFPDARGRAQGRGDGADRQGSEGRRSRRAVASTSPSLPPKRSDEPIDPRSGQARRRDRGGAALRLLPSADACRSGPDAAHRQAAHRLPDRCVEILPRQPARRRGHGHERAGRRHERRRYPGARALPAGQSSGALSPRTRRSASRCSRAAARSAACWDRRTPSAR